MAALSAVGAVLLVLAGPVGSARPAVAGPSVSGLTVDNSSPSAAAAAKTVYVVSFTTSRTGRLTAAGSQITLVFPAGTDLGSVVSSSVDNTTTGANGIGSCNPPSGETITCGLDVGDSIAAGDSVRVTINGVINPSSPGAESMSVSTTQDSTPASAAYNVVAANQISQPTVVNSSPSAAAGAKTAYVVQFATSATGGLSASAGSMITLVFPTGTNLGSIIGSSVDDTTTAVNGIGMCNAPSGETITCFLNAGQSITAGDSVRVTIEGVTNPSGPSSSLTVSVSTTSDTTPVNSAPYSVVSANQISQPTVVNSSPSAAAGAKTVYVVQFATSATGGLSAAAGSGITLVFPAGTGLGSVTSSSVDDTTTSVNGIGACNKPSGETITCFLNAGQSIAAGDSVRVTINGVTNPATVSSSLAVSVSTTSDITPAGSAPYSVSPPPPVPGVSVDVALVSGKVFVRRPGQKVFVRLLAAQQIPVGSTINATRGVVSLIAARDFLGHTATARDSLGHTATAQAHAGVFRVKQERVGKTELTDLALAGPKPRRCPATAATVARPKRHRAVWIRDPGYFVGRGVYASARDQATTGADWLTEDTCRGTLVRVKRGAVLVQDFAHHRTLVLRAGAHFLAHPGKGG